MVSENGKIVKDYYIMTRVSLVSFRTAEVYRDGLTDFHYSPIALNMKRRKGKEEKGKEGREKKSQKRDSSINDLLLVMMRVVRW